jgi:hypothetical protein
MCVCVCVRVYASVCIYGAHFSIPLCLRLHWGIRYDISYKQRVGTEDVYLGMSDMDASSASCTEIVFKARARGGGDDGRALTHVTVCVCAGENAARKVQGDRPGRDGDAHRRAVAAIVRGGGGCLAAAAARASCAGGMCLCTRHALQPQLVP